MFEIALLYQFKKYLYNASKINSSFFTYVQYIQETVVKGGKSSQRIIKCHSRVFKNAEVLMLSLVFNGSSAASKSLGCIYIIIGIIEIRKRLPFLKGCTQLFGS